MLLIFSGVTENGIRRFPVTYQNKYSMIINELRCPDKRNLVFCWPGWQCLVPAYEYRDSDSVKVFRDLSLEHLKPFDEDSPCILYIKDKRGEEVPVNEAGFAWFAERISWELKALEFLQQEPRYDVQLYYPQHRFQDYRFPTHLGVYRPNPEASP
jgi:hypothetical protein